MEAVRRSGRAPVLRSCPATEGGKRPLSPIFALLAHSVFHPWPQHPTERGRHSRWPARLYCFSDLPGSGATVTKVVTLPSRPNFRTRGRQPSLGPPFAFVYSRMKSSPRWTATPGGDQGRAAFTTLSTLPAAQ